MANASHAVVADENETLTTTRKAAAIPATSHEMKRDIVSLLLVVMVDERSTVIACRLTRSAPDAPGSAPRPARTRVRLTALDRAMRWMPSTVRALRQVVRRTTAGTQSRPRRRSRATRHSNPTSHRGGGPRGQSGTPSISPEYAMCRICHGRIIGAGGMTGPHPHRLIGRISTRAGRLAEPSRLRRGEYPALLCSGGMIGATVGHTDRSQVTRQPVLPALRAGIVARDELFELSLTLVG